jgi:hypothetical protein
MTPHKDCSFEVAQEILKYQIKIINENVDEFNSIMKGLEFGPETLQLVPNILGLILNNHIFEKFGFEEEDFMKNLAEDTIVNNPELLKVFGEMEMSVIKLMQKLDIFPPEVAEMMKQQQAALQQMEAMGVNPSMLALAMNQGMGMPGMGMPGAGMPGMGMPGMGMQGMGPSTNPMDMLQMQQVQQMQSMFSQMGMNPPK